MSSDHQLLKTAAYIAHLTLAIMNERKPCPSSIHLVALALRKRMPGEVTHEACYNASASAAEDLLNDFDVSGVTKTLKKVADALQVQGDLEDFLDGASTPRKR